MGRLMNRLIVLLALIRTAESFVPARWTTSLSHSQARTTRLFVKLSRATRARDLVQSLVEEEECFTSEAGARAFGEACAVNVVYEDRFEPQPVVGRIDVTNHMVKKVAQRAKAKGPGLRIDKISDGNKACGFAWTWTCDDGALEGLRGTTYVELNDDGLIQYVQEIPEPLFKPGDATRDLLQALTKDALPKERKSFEQKTPTIAHEVAKYLFVDLQNAEKEASMKESLRLFADNIIYRDFNYEDVLRGKAQVKQFIEDFSFDGIEFRPLRFDDGVDSTCFTWEVALDGATDTIKGLSFYELDPGTRKIRYVRDVPESAIKPPILGKLARDFRPGLGVFQGFPAGSRPEGM